MRNNSLAIEIIKNALTLYSLATTMCQYSKEEVNQIQSEFERLLNINPDEELERALESLNAMKKIESVPELWAEFLREREKKAKEKPDDESAILRQYENQLGDEGRAAQ